MEYFFPGQRAFYEGRDFDILKYVLSLPYLRECVIDAENFAQCVEGP